jgi:hypothetical protein
VRTTGWKSPTRRDIDRVTAVRRLLESGLAAARYGDGTAEALARAVELVEAAATDQRHKPR